MEITLEKIELVKDRTGVSYKEAKDALENANGSVVDAIIGIEESIDFEGKGNVGEKVNDILDRIKEFVKKGNVSKITIKKNDETLLNLPVNVGIVGTVLAPWAAVAGVLVCFGTKCEIELIKDDGEIIDISDRANDAFSTIMEKGSVMADEVKTKGSDVFTNVKDKASDAMNNIKSKTEDDDDDDDDSNERVDYDD